MNKAPTWVRSGLDVLLNERPGLLGDARVGLVTNSSAITANATPIIDALRPVCNLVALFGPEHGLYAHAADGAAVSSTVDAQTGLPIHSLYGLAKNGRAKKPTADMLRGIDLLLFDIQDVGARFYTYIWTMSYVLESAAEHGVPLIVLDRPNPIGGQITAGPVIEPGFESFVGRYLLPLRHGLTMGELARLFNTQRGLNADLTVIPAQWWRRAMWFDQTGLPWAPPSPAMPKPETAVVYPGTCLLEGTNVSAGRGTATPFELLGAPWIDGHRLADALNARSLPGVRFRPTFFTPSAAKYAGQTCGGVFLHVLDRSVWRPLQTGLHIIAAIRALWPSDSRWLESSWEGRPAHLDLLIGNGWVRKQLDAGVAIEQITERWQNALARFNKLAQKYFLYT